VEETVRLAGRLDILVNNAGITRRAAFVDITEADYDAVLQVNLKAVFFLSQAVARHFVAQKRGKIIHIASMLSYQGGIRVPPYTASKSAIAGVTRNMANELAPHGVNVNAIAPGYILTTQTQLLKDDPNRNPAILARIPAARWGDPADLAGAVVYLASAASDYCHGTILNVDGGWLAR
jgi:2-deoxy-D-gluconate 3-dehydrogenase